MENRRTAFITGGASGIGLGIAKACAKEGMNVVIADLRQTAIDEALPIFKENNWPAHGIVLNVTDRAAFKKAADEAEAVFGKIHLLVNNAGIGGARGPLWEVTPEETDVAIDINLTGVLNGIQAIVPRILAHGEWGHVVSTASKAALIAVPGCGLYNITKQALVAMMETLAMDLEGTAVGSSIFCPGPFQTNLGVTSREIEAEFLGADVKAPPPPRADTNMDEYAKLQRSADEAGERVVRGVLRGDLYIFTHPEFKEGLKARMDAMLRAFPDEAHDEDFKRVFSFLVWNDTFDKQTVVPAFEK